MKKKTTLIGFIAVALLAVLFVGCASTTAWWAGEWIWGAPMLLSPGAEEPAEQKVILSGNSLDTVTGVFVTATGEELKMSNITIEDGQISFTLNSDELKGRFNLKDNQIVPVE